MFRKSSCWNRSHHRVPDSCRALPVLYLWHWKEVLSCLLPGLVWGQEHKEPNSNYRPSPNSDEDSGVWPYFLPLFLYICLYSVFYLDLKVFNTQEKWLYLSVPLVFYGKQFEAHSKNCVPSCQWNGHPWMILSAHCPWVHLSFAWTPFDSWCSMSMRWL